MTKARPAPALSKSLVVPDACRRRLLRLTADQRARIVYGVHDEENPVPHVGVVLAGRQLVAWITESGWENDQLDTEGSVASEAHQSVVPCPGADNPLRLIRQGGDSLPLLRVHRRTVGKPDDQGFPAYIPSTEWQRRVCEDMTAAIGMVEIIKPNWQAEDWTVVGVLVPADRQAWACMAHSVAKSRAEAERKVPLPDDPFPLTHRIVDIETPDGAGTLRMTSASTRAYLRSATNPAGIDTHALTEIVLEGVPGVTLEARRGFRDFTWSVHLHAGRDPGRVNGFHVYPGLVDGAEALAMVIEAARTFVLPPPPPADPNVTLVAQRAYIEHMAGVWDKERRMRFVLDALGLPSDAIPYEVTERSVA